jgi:DNA-binding GntR family transcriptional regulator
VRVSGEGLLRNSDAESATMRTSVSARLREDILIGRFRPSQKLRLEELRGIYEVGFSPLREALMQLASEGLVTAQDRRGFRAAPMSGADLAEITAARIDIEAIALADAVRNGDDAWEGEIVSSFYRLGKLAGRDAETGAVDPEWARRHQAFHLALIAACRNRWIVRFWSILYDQADRYRRIAVATVTEGRLDEHRLLMEAALARDAGKLLEVSRAHIMRTSTLVGPLIEADGGAPGSL